MTDSRYERFFLANEKAWDIKTPVHLDSEFYHVEKFKQGESSLYPIELHEMGSVVGKSILHLQCHFGLDTISWARLGAKCTGVDFSGESIKVAQSLANVTKANVRFVKENVYNIAETIPGKFDIIYCSYGALNWLPDLRGWSELIYSKLKKGGLFYVVDFHPLLIAHECLEDDHITGSYYNTPAPISRTRSGSYANEDANIEYVEFTWNHSISEIVNALTQSGLSIKSLNEFPYLPFNCFPNLVQYPDKNWRFKNYEDKFPLCFSIKAYKN